MATHWKPFTFTHVPGMYTTLGNIKSAMHQPQKNVYIEMSSQLKGPSCPNLHPSVFWSCFAKQPRFPRPGCPQGVWEALAGLDPAAACSGRVVAVYISFSSDIKQIRENICCGMGSWKGSWKHLQKQHIYIYIYTYMCVKCTCKYAHARICR